MFDNGKVAEELFNLYWCRSQVGKQIFDGSLLSNNRREFSNFIYAARSLELNLVRAEETLRTHMTISAPICV